MAVPGTAGVGVRRPWCNGPCPFLLGTAVPRTPRATRVADVLADRYPYSLTQIIPPCSWQGAVAPTDDPSTTTSIKALAIAANISPARLLHCFPQGQNHAVLPPYAVPCYRCPCQSIRLIRSVPRRCPGPTCHRITPHSFDAQEQPARRLRAQRPFCVVRNRRPSRNPSASLLHPPRSAVPGVTSAARRHCMCTLAWEESFDRLPTTRSNTVSLRSDSAHAGYFAHRTRGNQIRFLACPASLADRSQRSCKQKSHRCMHRPVFSGFTIRGARLTWLSEDRDV